MANCARKSSSLLGAGAGSSGTGAFIANCARSSSIGTPVPAIVLAGAGCTGGTGWGSGSYAEAGSGSYTGVGSGSYEGSGSGAFVSAYEPVILAVVFPSGTMPSSSIPALILAFSSLRRRAISFLSALIISFAIFSLHFSQVISLRSFILPIWRYFVSFPDLRRLTPQPVFLPLLVPCTSSLNEVPISITSIKILQTANSDICGCRFTAAVSRFWHRCIIAVPAPT